MQQIEEIRRMASRVAETHGLELVDLVLRGARGSQLLRVDVDRAGPQGVSLADCQRVSEELGAELEASELIPTAYVLEVSSPGVDRPLCTGDDFRRSTGRSIAITATDRNDPIVGQLLECREGQLVLEQSDGSQTRIDLANVQNARQTAGWTQAKTTPNATEGQRGKRSRAGKGA